MQWSSQAIVLKHQIFSENKLLCWLFSQTHGIYKGLFTLNNKTRNQIQVGNIVEATWRARLPEHLGSYYIELIKPLSITILENKHKLTSIASICSLLSTALPERVEEKEIYKHALSFLLTVKDHNDWIIDYMRLELLILQELGYGLSFKSCVISGDKDNIYYVSPKTGNSVTKKVGSEYHDKLLRIPIFFVSEEIGNEEDIILGLKLTGHFLNKYLYQSNSKDFPQERMRFEKLYSNFKTS